MGSFCVPSGLPGGRAGRRDKQNRGGPAPTPTPAPPSSSRLLSPDNPKGSRPRSGSEEVNHPHRCLASPSGEGSVLGAQPGLWCRRVGPQQWWGPFSCGEDGPHLRPWGAPSRRDRSAHEPGEQAAGVTHDIPRPVPSSTPLCPFGKVHPHSLPLTSLSPTLPTDCFQVLDVRTNHRPLPADVASGQGLHPALRTTVFSCVFVPPGAGRQRSKLCPVPSHKGADSSPSSPGPLQRPRHSGVRASTEELGGGDTNIRSTAGGAVAGV